MLIFEMTNTDFYCTYFKKKKEKNSYSLGKPQGSWSFHTGGGGESWNFLSILDVQ